MPYANGAISDPHGSGVYGGFATKMASCRGQFYPLMSSGASPLQRASIRAP